ncbi:MAG: IS630 family transposase [Chloroflexi bacterium]|nr:IS630 family transposase [Chloroflexota bacterium]
MAKKYIVTLTSAEREQLWRLTHTGKAAARKIKRAHILLKADDQHADARWTDEQISEAYQVHPNTIAEIRKRFVLCGLEAALKERPRGHRARSLDGEAEAHLIALACSPAPEGHAHWTLRLLANRLVELQHVETVSHETIRQTLKKNELKPWRKEQWCIPPKANAAFVCQMETILDIYKRQYQARLPVVCLDELNKQLVSETREPLPVRPGQPARYDYEYQREGVVNAFILFEPLGNWRNITIHAQRTHREWALVVKDLVDVHFPAAERITLVLDHLNTHVGASLYKVLAPSEARRLLDKLDLQYTPTHGSWLNMAEIELSVFSRQCLNRRIADRTIFQRVATTWSNRRNDVQSTVDWQFTTADARIKLKHLYPTIQS